MMRRLLIFLIVAGIIALVGFFLFASMNYSDGNRSGKLIKFSNRGYIFKTHEGELNLGGINAINGGVMANYLWNFSVNDEKVAKQLMDLVGKDITVHYNQKMKALPWNGDTQYLVDSVIAVN
jgi:hypothetical protein